MKQSKQRRVILVGLILLLIILLVWMNRSGTRTEESLYRMAAIEVRQDKQTVLLDAKKLGQLSTEAFEATFQRKVGTAQERSYTGVSLLNLLAAAGVSTDGVRLVAVISQDQYRIELPVEEALRPGNLFFASLQDGTALSAEDGPYMLVIREDTQSTRWVRRVVRLELVA